MCRTSGVCTRRLCVLECRGGEMVGCRAGLGGGWSFFPESPTRGRSNLEVTVRCARNPTLSSKTSWLVTALRQAKLAGGRGGAVGGKVCCLGCPYCWCCFCKRGCFECRWLSSGTGHTYSRSEMLREMGEDIVRGLGKGRDKMSVTLLYGTTRSGRPRLFCQYAYAAARPGTQWIIMCSGTRPASWEWILAACLGR